jgi:hypothetical protein
MGATAILCDLRRKLSGFHDDRAKCDGGEEDERPESESAKSWQDAAREQILIRVHDLCRTPETQPFNPVSRRIHPQQADTHNEVKRCA